MTEANALHALLEVQAHDTKLDQLRHQLAALPERAECEQATATLAETEQRIEAVGAERAELAREQKRIDDEVELLRDKRDGFDKKLYGGTVSNPRELQDLQDEIDALGRRITHLEDAELEVMEQVEPLDASLVDLANAAEAARAALADAEARLVAASAELDAAIATETEVREGAAASVDSGLVAEYDRLRSGLGGVGIARLVGSQCGGCHLGLSAMEVARIRKLPAGEVVHCEECGRILVP